VAEKDQEGAMIYFLQNGATVKIGYAADANLRTDYLQTGSPHNMEVLGTIEGGYEDENELHRRFAHLHIRGEWFRLEKELMFFISDVLNPVRYADIRGDGNDRALSIVGAESVEVSLMDNSIYVHVGSKNVFRVKHVERIIVDDLRFDRVRNNERS